MAFNAFAKQVDKLKQAAAPRKRGQTDDSIEVEAEHDVDDPYAILGIEKGAAREQVEDAYRKRIGEYHPDKLANLSDDLRKVAERKARAVEQAYKQIKESR